MAYLEIDIDNETQTCDWEEAITGYPVLNVNTDEVGIITPTQQEAFDKEVERMEKFTPYMACFLQQETDLGKEQDRIYQTHAVLCVYKRFLDAVNDDALSDSIIENLEENVKEETDKLKSDDDYYEEIIKGQHKIAENVHAEVLKVRGKKLVTGARMVRVRSEKIKNHNRWFNRKQVKQQLAKELRESHEASKKTVTTAEANFFKKEIWKEDAGLVKSIEEFNKECNNEFFTDNAVLDSNINAQFLRYSTEAVAEGKAVWNKDTIDVSVGAKAEGTFSAASAQGSFKIQLPDENGFGLMQFLKNEAPDYVDDDFTEVFLKVIMETTGNAFVGACASVSADLGLQCKPSENKQDVKAQAGVSLFAGAKAQADSTFAVQVMFVEDENLDKIREETKTVGERGNAIVSAKELEDRKLGKWDNLASVSAGVYGAIGFGLDATFMFGYVEQRFRLQVKIGATVKLGAGSFLKGEVAPVLVGKFILTIAQGFNWKGISDKLNEEAHLLYHTILNNCFYLNKKVEDVYNQFVDKIDNVMDIIKTLDGFVAHGLENLKITDDKLDELIPGYSSYKQYNMAFIVLRESYHFFKEVEQKNKAIYTVLEAKNDRKRWNYATWQMKVNLIYDMRDGLTDWIDDYSDEERGEAVLTVLETARHGEEFTKVINSLTMPEEDVARSIVKVDSMLSKNQLIQYNRLKINFNYIEL